MNRLFNALKTPHILFVYLFVSINADDSVTSGVFPNANLTVPWFTEGVSFRQNFCDVQSQFHNGEVELRTAFEGRNLHVALGPEPDYVFLNEDGSINQGNPGLMVKLLDEIALRGKFSWRDTFVWEDYNAMTVAEKDWTDFVFWSVSNYDMSANWWFDSRARTSMGISFPKGWMDGSLIIVTTKDDDSVKDAFQPFSWATPFTGTVWLAIVVTLIMSALVSALVEGNSRQKTVVRIPFKESLISTMFSYLHQAFLVVCGHLDIVPNTHAGQLVSFSISFFAMLLLSAYTANLASFLVVERASAKLAISSIKDVVANRQTICVWKETAAESELRLLHPDAMLVGIAGDEAEVLKALRDGDCEYAVVSLSNYELYIGKEEINSDCNLVRVGRDFRSNQNGFAVKTDAGTLCTSLVREMLNVHLKDLHEEGYIKELWSDLYSSQHDIRDQTCLDNSPEVSSDTMNLTNVGGIFLIHGGLLMLAILVYLIERQIRKKNNGKDFTRKDHKQFQNSLDVNPNFLGDDVIFTEMTTQSNKIDAIENKVEDLSKTMAEMLILMKELQQGQVQLLTNTDDPNTKKRVYLAQETFNTATSSIRSVPGGVQYDLGKDYDDESFRDDDFSYDTKAVFR